MVAAASAFQAIDDSRLQNEEEEAFAQAKLWQDIADKSGASASSGAGEAAVQAADWALERAMKSPPKKSRIEDDESV